MNILICDDEKIIAAQLGAVISGINPGYLVKSICSSGEFERLFDSEKVNFDLVLMDIMLKNESGIELGSAVHRKLPDAKIIYMSGVPQRAQETFFDFQPFGFIAKPIDTTVLERYIMRADNFLPRKKSVFEFFVYQRRRSVSADSILCFESIQRHIHLCTVNGGYIYYGRLDEAMLQLPDCFVKCHKSYIVNLCYVAEIRQDSFLLTDGRIIPISRSQYKNSSDKWYWFRGGGGH